VTVTEEVPAPADEGAASEPDTGRDRARVPNVVGENHRYAQDTLQDAGFYALDERDCSGQGRLLLWDRNWVVRKQSPAPGSRVSVDRTITLCSVKEGE
jgi:beta-lactam-binding protein with PASTA domain